MPAAPTTPHIRVLVVDDEENQRAGLAKMIQSWGFVVDTAFDGQDALEKFNQAPPHVLVTDLMMPRMDGFELLKRLGSQNVLPPAIVLTAFGNIETAVQTMHDLGAFWFLEKPIQPSALKVLLERAATQSRLAEEAERLQRQLLYQGVLVDLVGTCSAMQQVFSLIRQVAPFEGRGASYGRKRHRQGIGGAGDPSSQPAGATVHSWPSIAPRFPRR